MKIEAQRVAFIIFTYLVMGPFFAALAVSAIALPIGLAFPGPESTDQGVLGWIFLIAVLTAAYSILPLLINGIWLSSRTSSTYRQVAFRAASISFAFFLALNIFKTAPKQLTMPDHLIGLAAILLTLTIPLVISAVACRWFLIWSEFIED